jgi:hypothetical protein
VRMNEHCPRLSCLTSRREFWLSREEQSCMPKSSTGRKSTASSSSARTTRLKCSVCHPDANTKPWDNNFASRSRRQPCNDCIFEVDNKTPLDGSWHWQGPTKNLELPSCLQHRALMAWHLLSEDDR